MSNVQTFEELLASADAELRLKSEAHKAWGFGKFDDWSFDQDEAILRFTNRDGTIAEAPAEIAGTFDTESETWLWGWANESLYPDLTGTPWWCGNMARLMASRSSQNQNGPRPRRKAGRWLRWR